MFKAGATIRDKNNVKRMTKDGRSPQEISSITRLSIDHVKAIMKQVKDGTLFKTVKTGKAHTEAQAKKAAKSKKKPVEKEDQQELIAEGE